jgi:hypothetical protein
VIHATSPLPVAPPQVSVPKTAPLPQNSSFDSATLSLPLAVMSMLLPVKAPLEGEVIDTVGGVVSPLTIVVTALEDTVALAESVTVTINECWPADTVVVSQPTKGVVETVFRRWRMQAPAAAGHSDARMGSGQGEMETAVCGTVIGLVRPTASSARAMRA